MDGRQVAMKVRLQDIANGTYVRVNGEWEPNFIQTTDGRTISRANVIGVVVSEPEMNNFVIDDGTAKVPVRIFNDMKMDAALGDVVLLIGRPREFNQQIFIVPEIIKKIENKKWIDYRKLELSMLLKDVVEPKVETIEPVKQAVEPVKKQIDAIEETDVDKPVSEEKIEKPQQNEPEVKTVEAATKEPPADEVMDNPIDKIIEIIKDMDKGDGADTEEVIDASKVSNCEQILDNLLKEGEIFEITSGKLKVLE